MSEREKKKEKEERKKDRRSEPPTMHSALSHKTTRDDVAEKSLN